MAGIAAAIIIIVFGIFSIGYTNYEDRKDMEAKKKHYQRKVTVE